MSSSGYVGFTLQVTPTVIIPKPGRLYHQSFLLECQFGRSESSGFPVCFLPRHWCGCVPAPRVRSCRIVSVGNGFGQPSGVVAVAGGVTSGVGDIHGDLVEVV